MPKVLVECPFCGQKVADGRFCKSCGRPLHEERGQEWGHSRPPRNLGPSPNKGISETGPQGDEEIRPDFGFSLDGVDLKMLGVLLAKAELHVIGEDLDRLISEIGATRQALLLDHADRDLLASRAENLREAFEKTKDRRTRLIGVKGSLPIEGILDELTVQESKLLKLAKMKRSIDADVYREEHERIALQIKTLRVGLKKATDESRGWLTELDKKTRELKRESNRLEARFKIGDIATGSYEESKLQVDRSIRILEGGKELLRSILSTVRHK